MTSLKTKSIDNVDINVLRAWLSVVKTYHQCNQALASELADVGLTTAQYEILSHLQRHPGMTQQELASRCFAAKSGISMSLKQMELDRWVKRLPDPADARQKRLHLTTMGLTQATRSLVAQNLVISTMAKQLKTAEIHDLTDVMHRAQDALSTLKVKP